MRQEVLDHLGQRLMHEVRDRAIVQWDHTIEGRIRGVMGRAAAEKLAGLQPEHVEALRWLIPRIVDTTLHHVLWWLEGDESVDLVVLAGTEGSASARDTSDGLCGELYTEDGWIMRFSRQRYEEL